MLEHRAVAERRAGLGVRGAAHHADDQLHHVVDGLVQPVVPALGEMRAQRGEQGIPQRGVVLLGDAVLAVVAAQLGEEGDRLLGALGDEFVTQPAQGVAEDVRCFSMSGGNRSRAERSATNHRV